VADAVADIGIVGENEVMERDRKAEIVDRLGFAKCRLSLAIPQSDPYPGLTYFNGKRIATSYPNILTKFLKKNHLAWPMPSLIL
jgi:ATP phosphoribosyltransferase